MFGIVSGTGRDKNFGISEIKKYFQVGLDRTGPSVISVKTSSYQGLG